MANALATWTTTNRITMVLSHDFIASSVLNPSVVMAAPSPGLTRAYAARIAETMMPTAPTAAKPHRGG